jgi:hypothetical protein
MWKMAMEELPSEDFEISRGAVEHRRHRRVSEHVENGDLYWLRTERQQSIVNRVGRRRLIVKGNEKVTKCLGSFDSRGDDEDGLVRSFE